MTATTAPRDSQHIAELDGVRGLAILLVLVMHGLYIGPLVDPALLHGAYARIALLGWCGVDVFFVLSGFLITGILVRSKGSAHYFRNFYMRRILRIFPLYYLVVLVLVYGVARSPAVTAEGQAAYLLYLQNWWFALVAPASDFRLTITWSLAIEEQFYLVWPAIVWFASMRALRVVCAIMIAAAVLLRFVLLSNGFEHTHFLTPCRMDALAAGALLAVSPAPRSWFGWLATLAGAGGLLATALVGGASVPESMVQQRWGLLAALSFGVGVLSLARTTPQFGPLFRCWPLRSLGKYSYCIYLVHMPVVVWLVDGVLSIGVDSLFAWRDRLTPVGTVALFTLAVVVCSWLVAVVSWHLFEKWFLRLKRRFPAG